MEREIKQLELSNRLFVAVIVLFIGALILWVSQAFYNIKNLPGNYPREITVSAEGKAFATPDVALVRLGVTTEGIKVEKIVQDNTAKMNAILKEVKDLGVVEKDIQTTNYSLTPRYDYSERGERVFRGYTLNQEIRVKIRDFAKIGNVLEKSTSQGANLVSNLQFTVDDMDKVKESAKTDAIAKAKRQASLIAKETGLKLGNLKNVYENYPYPTPIYGVGESGSTMKAVSAEAPVIQAGEQEITVQVNLVYAIK